MEDDDVGRIEGLGMALQLVKGKQSRAVISAAIIEVARDAGRHSLDLLPSKLQA